mgnify:CR=1 FL=1
MKVLFLAALLSLAASTRAADNKLQFYYEGGKYFYFVSYESVSLIDNAKRTVHSGYTDKYGRTTFRVPAGRYTCRIMYRKKVYSFVFDIYKQANIRKVYFGDGVKTHMKWG